MPSNLHVAAGPLAELAPWTGDRLKPIILTLTGLSVPSASLTLAALAATGYVRSSTGALVYVAQVAAAVGPLTGGNGVYWVALHRNTTSTVTGWTRQRGTAFLWQLVATCPDDPPDGFVFARVTVAGSVISAVLDIRTLTGNVSTLDAADYFTRAELLDIRLRTHLRNVQPGCQAVLTAVEGARGPTRVVWPAGDYWLGGYATGQTALLLTSPPEGTCLVGHGARFVIQTNGTPGGIATTFILNIINPNRFRIEGFAATDLGFSMVGWGVPPGTASMGAYFIYLQTTLPYSMANPCREIILDQCSADHVTGLLYMQSDTTGVSTYAYSMQDITVRDCRVDTAYYGVTGHYTKGLRVELDCRNVRRGLIAYGQQDCNFDINANWTAGFAGANAFVEFAWRNFLGPSDPAVNYVENIQGTLRVSGVEACGSLVHLTHQGDDAVSHGDIHNVHLVVQHGTMTTAGSLLPSIPTLSNIVQFSHEFPAGTVKATTLSTWDEISVDGGFTIANNAPSGSAVKVLTVPTVPGTLELGAGFFSPYWDLQNICNTFRLRRGHGMQAIIPTARGASGDYAATYATRLGMVEVIDGRLFFQIQLQWTLHFGAGQLYIDDLVLPYNPTAGNNVTPSVTVYAAGFARTDQDIVGQIQGSSVYLLTVTQSTGALAPLPVQEAATLLLTGSYPI